MSTPGVSVIMPVYNTAAYLGQAIESILGQTFTDLELLIINDGSTDSSASVIGQYKDPRIIYVENEVNKGLVYTLNRGIDLARGEWIARMDGDDISLTNRLEMQLNHLISHPGIDILATRIALMDESGADSGQWPADAANISPEQIRNYLPRDNCIAHPSIMARAAVMKKFRYREEQSESEDYDLWLRLVASGIGIHKLNTVLLRHRIVTNSFTRQRQKNVFSKLARVKFRFIDWAREEGLDGPFVREVRKQAYIDLGKAMLKNLKKNLWGTGS